MKIAHQSVIAIGSNQVEIGLNIVVFVERPTRSVPVPGTVKEDIHLGGKLESILGEEFEGDFGSEQVTRMIG